MSKKFMKFIPYGTYKKLDEMVDSKSWRVRIAMAERGYGLDVLIKDNNYLVRKTAAIKCLEISGYKDIDGWLKRLEEMGG